MFFSAHARSVTILYRGETLKKSMSHYLVQQLATRANIHVQYRTEVVAAHGAVGLEAIDIRDAVTGETARLESGGLFAFIGADAETARTSRSRPTHQRTHCRTFMRVSRRRSRSAPETQSPCSSRATPTHRSSGTPPTGPESAHSASSPDNRRTLPIPKRIERPGQQRRASPATRALMPVQAPF